MPYLKKVVPTPEPVDCRILTAALDLFVNKGFHNVSVHDVQKQADVSIGSIYNHFGGKEGIAKALYKHMLIEMQDLVDCVISEKSTAIERCNEIISQLFSYTETHRNIIAYVFHSKHYEFITGEPPICDSSPFVAMRDIIKQGMKSGEIREHNLWVASSAIFGPPIRLIHLRLDGIVTKPLPTLLDETLISIWQGMLNDKIVKKPAKKLSLVKKKGKKTQRASS